MRFVNNVRPIPCRYSPRINGDQIHIIASQKHNSWKRLFETMSLRLLDWKTRSSQTIHPKSQFCLTFQSIFYCFLSHKKIKKIKTKIRNILSKAIVFELHYFFYLFSLAATKASVNCLQTRWKLVHFNFFSTRDHNFVCRFVHMKWTHT